MPLKITNLPGTLFNFTLGWFTEQWKSGKLILDPPFQRGSVWTPAQRAAFIETLIDDFPRPAIFVCEYYDGPHADKSIVIDGKQRLEAIFSFMQDEVTVRGEVFSQQDEKFRRAFEYWITMPVVLLRNETMRACAELYVRLLRAGTAHTEAEIGQVEQMLADGSFDS